MHPRPDGEHDHPDRAGRRSGLGSRRVVWGAAGASVLLHALVILLYPTLFERVGLDAPTFVPPEVTPQGVEVIRLIDIEPRPEPTEPEDPEQIEQVEEPAEEAEAPVLEGLPGIEIVPLGPSAAERLRPRLVDARLWRVLPQEFYELTLEQREELIVADRLTAWLDSANAAQAARDRLTDWTYTDADGGRWGISPGKLHLGDITLPLPINFGEPIGKREENAELVWKWEEIMRQAARADIELSWRERSEAIRARRDAERAAAAPDTTRGR